MKVLIVTLLFLPQILFAGPDLRCKMQLTKQNFSRRVIPNFSKQDVKVIKIIEHQTNKMSLEIQHEGHLWKADIAYAGYSPWRKSQAIHIELEQQKPNFSRSSGYGLRHNITTTSEQNKHLFHIYVHCEVRVDKDQIVEIEKSGAHTEVENCDKIPLETKLGLEFSTTKYMYDEARKKCFYPHVKLQGKISFTTRCAWVDVGFGARDYWGYSNRGKAEFKCG